MVAIAIIVITVIITSILLSWVQNLCGCLTLHPYVCKTSQQSEKSPKKTQTEKGLWKVATIRSGVFRGAGHPATAKRAFISQHTEPAA